MKQSGKYLARSLSFKGATFEVVDVHLTKNFEDMYDASVALWTELIRLFEKGMKNTPQGAGVSGDGKAGKKACGIVRGQIWSSHQRFFSQMLMAARVDETVRITQEAVEEGKCVVIGIQNTGEAGLTDDGGDNGCSVLTYIVKSLLEKNSTVAGFEFIAKEEKKKLLKRLGDLELPITPLDDLIDRLGGPRRVAEMTGRKTRQVCERGDWVLEKRMKTKDSEDEINIQERKKFMAGKKYIAIISDAASTGISLQADRRVQNDRRRVHITFQLPWSADKAVQQMGRSHRSNQSSAPEFKLLMTPIGGEWRFASAVAERLQQLGAITQGDRRATGGSGLSAFAVDGTYGMEAVAEFCQSVKLKRPWRGVDVQFLDPDASPEELEKNAKSIFESFAVDAHRAFKDHGLDLFEGSKIAITKFLNRLLGLKLKLQTQVFNYWHLIMEELIRDAKKTGKFQEGILDIGNELALEKESVLFEDTRMGIKTSLNKLVGDRGVSWKKAKKLLKEQDETATGFYRVQRNLQDHGFKTKHDVYNIFLALEKKQMVKNKSRMVFNTVEPHSGFRPDEILRGDLRGREYEKLGEEEAEKMWKHVYELSKDKCSCKVCDDRSTCELKKRTRAYHILTGSVLPFWRTIKSYMLSQEEDLDEEDQFTIKVVRVETKDNRRLVGILIPNENADKIKEKILNEARSLLNSGAFSGSVPDQLESAPPASKGAAQTIAGAKDADTSAAAAETDVEEEEEMEMEEDERDSKHVAEESDDTKEAAKEEEEEAAVVPKVVEKTNSELNLVDGSQDANANAAAAETDVEEEEEEEGGRKEEAAAFAKTDVEDDDELLEVEAEDDVDPTSDAVAITKTASKEGTSDDMQMDDGQDHLAAAALASGEAAACGEACRLATGKAGASAHVVVAAAQDVGDDTEDDSDTEGADKMQVAMVAPAKDGKAVAAEAIQSAAEVWLTEDVGNKSTSRDSILSDLDTPQKLLDAPGAEQDQGRKSATKAADDSPKPQHNEKQVADGDTQARPPLTFAAPENVERKRRDPLQDEGEGEKERAGKDSKSPSKSVKKTLNARLPAAESEGSEDEKARGDEMAMQDAESKDELKKLAQLSEDAAKASGAAVASQDNRGELEASGLWEHDDDAEEFFRAGLKILEEARRSDESARRRYIPSKDRIKNKTKGGGKGDKERRNKETKMVSRSGRLRKQTDLFASGKMKGQKYVNTGETEDDAYPAGSETETDDDDDATSGQSSKVEGARRKEKRERVSEHVRQPRAARKRQDASAVMLDKALKEDVDAKKVRFHLSAKDKLKEMTKNLLGGLLSRPELSGKMAERAVKQAIRGWIPGLAGVGQDMRGSVTPSKHLVVPKEPLKREIKALHPSCASGTLKSLSNKGIRRVEAILGFFSQALVQQVAGIALARGTKIITELSLMHPEQGIENLKDATLRHLLNLEPLPAPQMLVDKQQDADDTADLDAAKEPSQDGAITDDERAGESECKDGSGGSEQAHASASPGKVAVSLVVPVGWAKSSPASDDEGDKTESETDLDENEVEEDDMEEEGKLDANYGVTDDDEDMEEDVEADGDDDSDQGHDGDDFATRSHYCNGKCKFANQYRASQFMLCCESCDVWFHGKCLSYKEGDIAEEQVWVCCDNCYEDLPINKSKRDVIVGAKKRQYKKREPKEKTDKGDKAEAGEKKKRNKKAKEVHDTEDEEEEEEMVPWSEDYMPHFQCIVEHAPKTVDSSLVGRTIMYQLTTYGGWFPAKVKKMVSASKGKGNQGKSASFLLSYTRKATKGVLQSEHDTPLDISEYGKQGKGKWVLLQDRPMPAAEPGKLYCKKSCKHGRENGKDIFMIYCEGCEVWFHGKCVGVEDGDVNTDQVWVCCQKCKYDLPRNMRSDALVGNSLKMQQEAGTACTAKITNKPTFHTVAADDSEDDDVPILQRAAALATRAPAAAPAPEQAAEPDCATKVSDKGKAAATAAVDTRDDEPVVAPASSNGMAIMKILEPLATFVGTNRMPKRDALAAVLYHIRSHQLFDPEDEEYVLADAKLKPLVGNRTRVKLRKLAKRVATYIIDDNGKGDAKHHAPSASPATSMPPRPADEPPPPSGEATSGNAKMLLVDTQVLVVAAGAVTVLPTPSVVQAASLSPIDLPLESGDSPPSTQHNLKKRLGFSEVNSPAVSVCNDHLSGNAALSAHVQQSVVPSMQECAVPIAQQGEGAQVTNKKRRLIVESEQEQEEQAAEEGGDHAPACMAPACMAPDHALTNAAPPQHSEAPVESLQGVLEVPLQAPVPHTQDTAESHVRETKSPKRKADQLHANVCASAESDASWPHTKGDTRHMAQQSPSKKMCGLQCTSEASHQTRSNAAAQSEAQLTTGLVTTSAVTTSAVTTGPPPPSPLPSSNAPGASTSSATATAAAHDDDDDDQDLDFDAIEAQALSKTSLKLPLLAQDMSNTAPTDPSTSHAGGGGGGGGEGGAAQTSGKSDAVEDECWSDGLDDLTEEEIAEIERQALGL
jgi:hypothetical protein